MKQAATHKPAGSFAFEKAPKLTGRNLEHVAFPLGGIGTGSVSLGGSGQLRDWEIMNQPAKGKQLWFTFFMLKVDRGAEAPLIKTLSGPVGGDWIGNGTGANDNIMTGANFPHFRSSTFQGAYPFAQVALADELVPLDVTIEAFNPFIPLNDLDSSIPVAMLRYHLKNTSAEPISGTISGNLGNSIVPPLSAKIRGQGRQPDEDRRWIDRPVDDRQGSHDGQSTGGQHGAGHALAEGGGLSRAGVSRTSVASGNC